MRSNPKISDYSKKKEKSGLPDFRAGDTIIIYQKIKEGGKERIQAFEGVVLARKHGTGLNATFTVRKMSGGVAVERIFPLHAGFIDKIEVVKTADKVRRAKLYYLREQRGRRAKIKSTFVPEELGVAAAEGTATEEENTEILKERTAREIENKEAGSGTAKTA